MKKNPMNTKNPIWFAIVPCTLPVCPMECPVRPVGILTSLCQGQILQRGFLAAKLPNSDMIFAVHLGWIFSSKDSKDLAEKSTTKKNYIHFGLCSEKFPSDFRRSLLLSMCAFRQKSGLDVPDVPGTSPKSSPKRFLVFA